MTDHPHTRDSLDERQSGRQAQFGESGFLFLNLLSGEISGSCGLGAGAVKDLSLISDFLMFGTTRHNHGPYFLTPFRRLIELSGRQLVQLTQTSAANCRAFIFLASGVTLIVIPERAPPSSVWYHMVFFERPCCYG